MSSEAQVRTLLSEIEQSRAVLGRVAAFYQEYLARTNEVRDRTAEQAIVLAEVFVSYFSSSTTGTGSRSSGRSSTKCIRWRWPIWTVSVHSCAAYWIDSELILFWRTTQRSDFPQPAIFGVFGVLRGGLPLSAFRFQFSAFCFAPIS